MSTSEPAVCTAETPEASDSAKNASSPQNAHRFSFRCLNHSFEAWTQNDGDGPSVYVSCELGTLPYSAENRDCRRSALLLLSKAGTVARTRLMLSDFSRISIVAKTGLRDADDTVDLLSSVAAAVINSMPLITLTTECLSPATSPPPG